MVGTCYVAPVLIPSLGKLTLEEIAKHYNVTEHPLVKSGRLSEADALRNFIAHWHINNKAHTGNLVLAHSLFIKLQMKLHLRSSRNITNGLAHQ